jgi:hypothetical protein
LRSVKHSLPLGRRPFDWISSTDELTARIATIEWLPFAAYYGADPRSAFFDLGKKLFMVGPLGFILASRRWGRNFRSGDLPNDYGLLALY